MSQPRVSRRTYIFTFGGLLLLALATTLIGFLDLGPFSMILAMTFAAVKAMLIASFFTAALYESKLVRVVLAGGVIWFLIMIKMTIGDYVTRGWVYPLSGK